MVFDAYDAAGVVDVAWVASVVEADAVTAELAAAVLDATYWLVENSASTGSYAAVRSA